MSRNKDVPTEYEHRRTALQLHEVMDRLWHIAEMLAAHYPKAHPLARRCSHAVEAVKSLRLALDSQAYFEHPHADPSIDYLSPSARQEYEKEMG